MWELERECEQRGGKHGSVNVDGCYPRANSGYGARLTARRRAGFVHATGCDSCTQLNTGSQREPCWRPSALRRWSAAAHRARSAAGADATGAVSPTHGASRSCSRARTGGVCPLTQRCSSGPAGRLLHATWGRRPHARRQLLRLPCRHTATGLRRHREARAGRLPRTRGNTWARCTRSGRRCGGLMRRAGVEGLLTIRP